MAIRMPFPADVNPDPDAKYCRTLGEAFPHDASRAAAVQTFRRKSGAGLWLAAAVLVAATLALSGCSGAEAQERSASASELRRAAAGLWSCPGMTAVWLDDSTVQCLNHLP